MDTSIFPSNHWFSAIVEGKYTIALARMTLACKDEFFEGNGEVAWSRAKGFRVSGITGSAAELLRRFAQPRYSPGRLIPHDDYLRLDGKLQDGTTVKIDRLHFNSYKLHTHSDAVVWEIPNDEILDDLQFVQDRGSKTPHMEMLLWPVTLGWPREATIHVCVPFISEHRRSANCRLEYLSEIGSVNASDVGDRFSWWKVTSELDVNSVVNATIMALSFLGGRVVYPIATIQQTGEQVVKRLKRRDAVHTRNAFAHPLPRHSAHSIDTEEMLRCATDFFATDKGRLFARAIYPCWDLSDASVDTRLLIACVTLEGLLSVLGTSYQIPGGLSREDEEQLEKLRMSCGFKDLTSRLARRVTDGWKSWKRVRPTDILHYLRENRCIDVDDEDIKAWKGLRHPTAHGAGIWDTASEHQSVVDQFSRVSNLIVKLTLHQMGYIGDYYDSHAHCVRQFVRNPIEGTSDEK